METLSAKVPEDLIQRIEKYQNEYDLNRSQATRRLIEEGFEADRLRADLEKRRERDERTITFTKPAVAALLGWVLIVADWVTVPTAPVGLIGVAIIVAAVGYSIYTRKL